MEIKKLSDAEFDIMSVIWGNPSPIKSTVIMDEIGKDRGWKMPSLLTMLGRLVDKGFLSTEKEGRDRYFYTSIGKDEYRRFEVRSCLKYHDNSPIELVTSLYAGKQSGSDELDELIKWAMSRKG